MRWRCGRGIYAQTRALSAVTASTSLALNTRQIRRRTTRMVFLSRSAAVDTCSTWTAFNDGSRLDPYVRCATRSGNSQKSSVFRGTEASLSDSTSLGTKYRGLARAHGQTTGALRQAGEEGGEHIDCCSAVAEAHCSSWCI